MVIFRASFHCPAATLWVTPLSRRCKNRQDEENPHVKMHNSESIIEFSQAVDAFVSVLSSEQYFSDLQSSSNLSLLVSKLPINLREQWFAFTENSKSAVKLVSFRDWLQKKAMIHERLLLSSTKTEKCD